MEIEKAKIGIGKIEMEKLKPSRVEIVSFDISPPKDREGKIIKGMGGKELGDKVTFGCKHPDKEELIQISQVKYEKKDKLAYSGMWFQLDSEGKLMKGSALAKLLVFYGANSVSEMAGKQIDTVADEEGFLCVKAF